ncbi:replication initiator protein A [Butyrivibrio sp. AE3004]|uniref:replication initiator protein A n=1 Tax=Butyrivibrio sp. AE3004 TaxID=1506994 RepID=UPI00068CEAC7|nr:replication initiator protein A [Butyrivibrio sp. AE3004]
MTNKKFEELCNDTRMFYRLPKQLFLDPAYAEISNDAKLLYMILLDRRCLSESNGSDWRDEQGCVFIYSTIEEMMNLMNCGNKKINELLKELEGCDLVLRRHRGLGKPNRIYVYDLLRADNSNWKPRAFSLVKGGELYA